MSDSVISFKEFQFINHFLGLGSYAQKNDVNMRVARELGFNYSQIQKMQEAKILLPRSDETNISVFDSMFLFKYKPKEYVDAIYDMSRRQVDKDFET